MYFKNITVSVNKEMTGGKSITVLKSGGKAVFRFSGIPWTQNVKDGRSTLSLVIPGVGRNCSGQHCKPKMDASMLSELPRIKYPLLLE